MVSDHLFLEGKNVPFRLGNSSNLTHEYLFKNFNKKNFLKFFVQIVTQTLMRQI